jgi:hypothetical protein
LTLNDDLFYELILPFEGVKLVIEKENICLHTY